jgi:DNA-binding transcriptional MerR regulator
VEDGPDPTPRRPEKRASAFRTIGEVADDLHLPTHVLRFWESKFPQLRPLKRGGGRRYYRPEDVLLLRRIRQCLYQDGYTIRGVQQLLGKPSPATVPAAYGADMPSLFPVDAAPAPHGPGSDAPSAAPVSPPARRSRRSAAKPRALDPGTKAELEDIRRELLEARAALDELLRRETTG